MKSKKMDSAIPDSVIRLPAALATRPVYDSQHTGLLKRAKENAIRILKTTWYHDAATDYNITAKIGYCSIPQFLRTLKVQ